MSGWKTLSDCVLKYDYCCGCGVCAGVCPQNALEIRFNEYGEYKPYLVGHCTECGLCSKVCPFVNGNPNEDDIGKVKFGNAEGIKHTPETGYYLDSYVGYAADREIRWSGASGGLTTWLLCELLEKRQVDHVITVAPTGKPKKLFEYRVLSDPQEVRACAKSVYYPVELSGVLRHVLANPGQYALVGLPCFLKAVELVSGCLPKIHEKITVKIGLTCGQMNSALMPEYLVRLKNADWQKVCRISFREKRAGKPAHIYLFQAFACDGDSVCEVSWYQGYAKAFLHEYFMLNACTYCDDLFAECADVAMMDAWLPGYRDMPEGTNLALFRSPDMANFAKQAAGISLMPVSIHEVNASQAGGLGKKRGELAMRVLLAKWRNLPVARKRVGPAKWSSVLSKQGLYMWIKRSWRNAAKRAMVAQRIQDAPGLRIFHRVLHRQACGAFAAHAVFKAWGLLRAKVGGR